MGNDNRRIYRLKENKIAITSFPIKALCCAHNDHQHQPRCQNGIIIIIIIIVIIIVIIINISIGISFSLVDELTNQFFRIYNFLYA